VTLEELFRYIDPMQHKDVLGEFIEKLSTRSAEDQRMAFELLRGVFDWEERKHGKI